MTPENFQQQISNAIELRNHEHQTWLNIFYASFSTTSLLFVALFSGNQRQLWEVLIIASFGIFITVYFKRIQQRAFLTMRAYEEFSKLIESRLKAVDPDFCSYNVFRGNYTIDSAQTDLAEHCLEKPHRTSNTGKARNAINNFYIITIIIWSFMILIYTFITIKPYINVCFC